MAIFAVVVVLAPGWVARTDWAAARDVMGAGEGFSNALEPVVKITAAVLISVSGVHLMRDLVQRLRGTPRARGVPSRAGERAGDSGQREGA